MDPSRREHPPTGAKAKNAIARKANSGPHPGELRTVGYARRSCSDMQELAARRQAEALLRFLTVPLVISMS